MPFHVSDSTLESLEWDALALAWRANCRTPQGRERLASPLSRRIFEDDESAVRTRLRETTEARRLFDHDAIAPLSGCCELATSLSHAERGGVLETFQLNEIRTTLEAMHATQQFFDHHHQEAPTLLLLAQQIEEAGELESEINRCLDASGEVSDAASPSLAQARRDAHRISGELQ
ncbi:MAG: hypothetical protein VCB25_06385, partial [Myxococcota bacterium]